MMHSILRAVLAIFFIFTTLQAFTARSSEDEIGRLLGVISQLEDSPEKVDCFVLLSQHYRNINPDSSLLLCDQAFDMSEKIHYPAGKADALYKKSLTHKSMGAYKEAIYYGEEYLKICDSIQDSKRQAKAYFNLGNLKRSTSDKAAARAYYKDARRIFSSINDSVALRSVFTSLGNVYTETGVYDSAALYYHRAIEYSEALGSTNRLGRIIGNLGKVYIQQGDYKNAEKYLNISLELDLENEDNGHLSTTYAHLGTLAIEMNNFEDALHYYELSDSVYKISNDAWGIHLNLINRAVVYRNQGQYELAISSCRKALSYLREQAFADGIIAAWQGLAAVYSQIQMPEKAILYYDSCMLLAINTDDLNRQKEVLGDILPVYLQTGDYKNAFIAQNKLKMISDSIYKLEKAALISDLLLKYEKEKDQIRILNLENENLEQARQQNLIIFIGLGALLILLFLLFFVNYKSRKNKIISDQKIKQFEEEKKLLAARFIVEGQEDERKRVATAIHDSLGVLLSASKMSVTAIKDNNPENKALIEKATKFLDEASGEMRKISHNMMPGLLTKLGLYEALEDLIESLNDLDKIDARMEVVGPMKRIPENKEIMIYRIMQELVNNTLKHAEASSIDLTIIVHPDQLDISYSDNGIGFNRDETLDRKTMGIQNIRSRVKFLDGNVCIDSSQGKGTVYRINVPVDAEETPLSDKH